MQECWCANKVWRDTVNNLKNLGKRSPENRCLPEGPDPRSAWVIQEKLRLARGVQAEGADSRSLTRQMIEDSLKEMTIHIKPQDLEMLQNVHPEVPEMLLKMNEGSESPAWKVVDQDADLKDSVQARAAAKRRKLLEQKAGTR